MGAGSVDPELPPGIAEGEDSQTSQPYQTTAHTSADHAFVPTMVEQVIVRSEMPSLEAGIAPASAVPPIGDQSFAQRNRDGDAFSVQQMPPAATIAEPTSSLPLQSTDVVREASVVLEDAAPVDVDASMEDYGDEDGGVIRCICECDDDDGFTIQCDKCLVWQHCACFGMSQASVPEEYHCEQCDPRPVDVGYAKAHQQKRKETELKKASLERSIRRQHQANGASAALQGNVLADTAQSGQQFDIEHTKGHISSAASGTGGISRSRKPSQQLDLSNVNLASADGPTSASATPGQPRSGKKRGGGSRGGGVKRSSTNDLPVGNVMTPRTASMMANAAAGYLEPAVSRAGGEDRIEIEESMADRLEAWSVEFTPISHNLVSDEDVRATLGSAWRDYTRGHPLKAERGLGNRMIAPVVGKRVKTLANLSVSTPSDAVKSLNGDVPMGTTSTHGEHGLSAIGNECTPIEISTSNLGEHSQKTYVKQISEMASASIFNSLLQIHPLPSEPQRPWSASRTFHKPIMHGLFADVSIPAGCFIQEYVGEIGSADHYRRQAVNQYSSIGTSKPCVHILPPPLNICIDARQYGSTSRFARFSCHPNAILRPIVVKPCEEDDKNETERHLAPYLPASDSQIRFGLFAIGDITKTHEITLGWEWDDAHIIHILPQLVRNPILGVLDVSGKMPAPLLDGNQRSLERQRRHAAITALVERGDFPYAGTDFSHKMNSVLTILLGSCLCACIGSASPPGGSSGYSGGTSNTSNSSASSNNVKKQDCAISQMLRLSQGMSLLNVHIPGSSSATGKSNRKSKAPDFEPLVGVRRWWRPGAMPPTPRSSEEVEGKSLDDKKDECYRDLDVPFALVPGGKVGRVMQEDFDAAMERNRISARMEQLRREMDADDDEISEGGGDEVDSDASSLTEPLPHGSGGEEDDLDDSNVLDDNDVSIAKDEAGVSYLVRTALPPKKRVSGTRIKAVNSAEENSDVEYKGQKRRKGKNRNEKKTRRRKRSPVSKRTKSVSEQMQDFRNKRKKRLHEQSSPLTSAPSDIYSDTENSESSPDVTPTPTTQPNARIANRKRRSEGIEDSNGNDVRKLKEAKKKARLVKKRRRELLGELEDEPDSSSEEEDRQEKMIEDPVSSPVKKSAKKKSGVKAVIYSDEESEEAEGEGVVTRTPPGLALAEKRDDATSTASMQEKAAEVTLRMAAPSPIEVPKAKLSLADYKKRLAERRTTSATSVSNANTPLSTPALMMPSPEKMSQPNTPLSSSIVPQSTAFAFPPMPVSAVKSTETAMTPSALTPTTPRAEFAPPPPRFPRPTTPPRSISASATTASGELERPVPIYGGSVSRESDAQVMSASTNLPKRVEQVTIKTEVGDNLASELITSPLTVKEEQSLPAASESNVGRRGFVPPAPAGPGMPTGSTAYQGETMTFNPPRAPRALMNSALPGGITPLAETTSPVVLPLGQASPPAAPVSVDARHSRTPNSYDSAPQHQPFQRNVSPIRSSIHNAPRPSIGGPYQSSTSAASISAAAAASPASLNDFANVPKGPARMREREREREIREREQVRVGEDREFREPVPPPRERDWERDRDWEWDRDRDREQIERERDRDRDYLPRDAGFPRDHLRDRELDYFYSRRERLDDEEERGLDFAASRPPPPPPNRFAARGGLGGGGGLAARGGFAGPSRGMTPWAGRARTRGRGSRGSGVWR